MLKSFEQELGDQLRDGADREFLKLSSTKELPISIERINELQAKIPKDTPFFDGLVIFTRLIEQEHGIYG